MDEILNKLLKLYNDNPKLKDDGANVNITFTDSLKYSFTWRELYAMVEYLEAYRDGVLRYQENNSEPSNISGMG